MKRSEAEYDVIIIGAGASGLMCAWQSSLRGRKTIVIDHNKKAGRKIMAAGGGKCNFTNRQVLPENYISANPHFARSALKQFTETDFIQYLQSHSVETEERDHGRLFCRNTAGDLLNALLNDCRKAGAEFSLSSEVLSVNRPDTENPGKFTIEAVKRTPDGDEITVYTVHSLVIATGGVSFPKLGASPFGYRVAESLGIKTVPLSPGLVPLRLSPADLRRFSELPGIAVKVTAFAESGTKKSGVAFTENLLFTHRGISGPAVLQISNYWKDGDSLNINFLPEPVIQEKTGAHTFTEALQTFRNENPRKSVRAFLSVFLPRSLQDALTDKSIIEGNLSHLGDDSLKKLESDLTKARITPAGKEDYGTAEVTLGGIDTSGISSKTMEVKDIPGLFFTGEVLDVTGQLGGFNLQWAWSSGWTAGQHT